MDLNSIKRTILAAVCVLALSSVNAVAQEIRSEISLHGTGFFTKDADGNWIRQHATDTGGFLVAIATTSIVGLQQRRTTDMTAIHRFISGGTGTRVESNIHQSTGSAVVKLPSFAGLQPYALAGGGALVKNWAAILGPQGIRVNAVAPGVIDTDMSNFTKTEAGREATLGMQALKRIGKPEDMADVVAFLASDKARWITGASIPVDGGSKL
jgi:NAD(P)-dependent dehydrogenase (short-subunit alcohol dehydrogenase family)